MLLVLSLSFYPSSSLSCQLSSLFFWQCSCLFFSPILQPVIFLSLGCPPTNPSVCPASDMLPSPPACPLSVLQPVISSVLQAVLLSASFLPILHLVFKAVFSCHLSALLILFLFPGSYEKFNLNLFVQHLLCTQTKNVFIFVPKINPTSHRVVYSTAIQPGILSLFQYSLLGRR